LVGIAPSRDGDKAMMAMRYMDAVWYAGGLPMVLSYTTDPAKLSEYAEICDGFLFSGGVDVDPVKYGEVKQFDSVEIDEARDTFEEALFRAIYPTKKPILGICRGIQSINVWMGGTLIQHLDGHRQSAPAQEPTHSVQVTEGSMLHRLCGKTEIMVNTFHHQAVKNLAPALTADAVSPDGFIEAAHEEGHRFLFATQFHPECYWHVEDDDHSVAIFRAFLDACRS
jgi:putative glutamine amidotransferase